MTDDYNFNMYLTKDDLQDVENKIEELTEDIQEYIYDNEIPTLRTIQVGDKLNSRTLYFLFPFDIYDYITTTETTIIKTTNENYIKSLKTTGTVDKYDINLIKNGKSQIIYRKESNKNSLSVRMYKIKMDIDAGVVDQINTNSNIYNYIKIYDDETLIPTYDKHTWQNNEVSSMQKIDNIENGIKNIGDYYYRHDNWITDKEWLNNTGVNIKNISSIDLNRWWNNLKLINFDDLNKICIWNGSFSNVSWDIIEQNNPEWEDM